MAHSHTRQQFPLLYRRSKSPQKKIQWEEPDESAIKPKMLRAKLHHSIIILHQLTMQAAVILTVASLAAVLGVKPEEVKSDAASARYGNNYYGAGPYGGGPGFWQPLLQDRFVCDLDASVLLVVDHNRHHHHHNPYYGTAANRAVRVKCSEVANNDEDSCNYCCQQTARRDTTLANDKLFGFLAVTKIEDDKTFTRSKRDVERLDDDEEDDREERRRRGGFRKTDPTYVVQEKWTPSPYDTNVKCVCCAPRTSPVAQNPSTGYGNTAAQSPATSNYGAPAQDSSSYSANTATVTQPQPIAAAAQPFVDLWQTDSATATGSWGAAADAAPAATPAPVNSY
uniref:Uncharacterized protein n=1 Tax=Caenorhabditis japonica TaxID=281687 RepID=A0A8R1I229_CAEJA